MFKILIQPDVGTSYLSKILLLYGAKTNKTLASVRNKIILNNGEINIKIYKFYFHLN